MSSQLKDLLDFAAGKNRALKIVVPKGTTLSEAFKDELTKRGLTPDDILEFIDLD